MTHVDDDGYPLGEEIANSILHGLGAVLALAGLVTLVTLAAVRGTAWHVVGCAVFGGTLVAMFASSTLYHSITSRTAKRVLRVIDHVAIYLVIAGTYTPFMLVTLRGPWGWSLLAIVWTAAVVGIVLASAVRRPLEGLRVTIYIVMGWVGILAYRPMLAGLGPGGMSLLVAGGVAYTLGVVFFRWRSLLYHHAIWHVFVLAGAALHFFAVLWYVVPPALERRAQELPAGLPAVLTLQDRDALRNRWLAARFERVLPEVMRREQIDMWVVICREHAEDPVYATLVPHPSHFAWRLTMFVYFDRGASGVERLVVNPYGSGDLHKAFAEYYTPAFEPAGLDPWRRLALLVKARNPKRIAVNESETFAFADGLSASSKARLVNALGPELAGRLVSAERVAVGWLERRSAEELAFYPQIVALNHRIIAEAFSGGVITPGKTTIDDLAWWVRERIAGLKLGTWFQPMFYIVRPAASGPPSRVVQRGDLLRCDIGITYVGLTADNQQVAYVLRDGEADAPKGLRDALATGNRLQDILVGEFRAGARGNDVLAAAIGRARAEGLVPRIYSHPIGYHGHAAGSRVGLPDMQDGVPGMGDYPLHPDTCWAIELGVRVAIPEWGGQEIQMALEEDAAFTASGVSFLDGRQTRLHLIR